MSAPTSSSSATPEAAAEAKQERFERLKAQYRQQLRAARLRETAPTADVEASTNGPGPKVLAHRPAPITTTTTTTTAATTAHSAPPQAKPKAKPKSAYTDPLTSAALSSKAGGLPALRPVDAVDSAIRRQSSEDEHGSSISVSPLTTPGTSYTNRVRAQPTTTRASPKAPATNPAVKKTAKPVAKAAAVSSSSTGATTVCADTKPRREKPDEKAAKMAVPDGEPRLSFASEFANLYAVDPKPASTAATTAPVLDGTPKSTRGANSPVSGSSGKSGGLQLRMSQRPLSSGSGAGGGLKSPSTPQNPRVPSRERRASVDKSPHKAAPVTQPTAPKPAAGTKRTVSAQGAQMEQMEAVMDYVESITQALAHRTKSLPPPDSLIAFRASITPATRRGSDTTEAPSASTAAHFSLLSELHDTSSALLSWFSKLEYPRLPKDVSLEEVEQNTLRSCQDVVALVEKIDRKFSTHEVEMVREGYAERRGAVVAHRELVDAVARTAQHIVVLRRLVHDRDLDQVCEVLAVHKREVDAAATSAAATRSSGPTHISAMLTGPYFTWLQQRWLPAMRAWRQMTQAALQEAQTTHQYRAAIATAQREALGVPHLHDILRPGETLSELQRVDVVDPIEALATSGAELQAAMRALEAAMATPSLTELAKAIRHAQTCIGESGAGGGTGSHPSTEVSPSRRSEDRPGHPLSSPTSEASHSHSQPWTTYPDERAAIKRAQVLLVQVQQAESSLRAMRMAHQVPGSTLSLFQIVHRANELLYRLNLGVDAARVQTVVRLCRPVAQLARESRSRRASTGASGMVVVVECDKHTATSTGREDVSSPSRASASRTSPSPQPPGGLRSSPPADTTTTTTSTSAARAEEGGRLFDLLAARDLGIEDVCLPHTHSMVWTDACVEAYQQVCTDLAQAYAREVARANLEDDVQQHRSVSSGRGSPSTSLASTALGPSADDLRAHIQRAEELGLSGSVVEQARELLKQCQSLRLKVHFQAQTRLIQLIDPTTTNFAEVYEQLYAFCVEQALLTRTTSTAATTTRQDLRIRYEDVDGDYISIVNDADWALMLSETYATNPSALSKARRIDLYCDFPVLPSDDPAVVRHQHTQEQASAAAAAAATNAADAVDATAPTAEKRAPGMTRSVELRLATARSRSAGVPTVTRSAAFAPRSRSGTARQRSQRMPPTTTSTSTTTVDGDAAADDANVRLGRRVGPRRVLRDASGAGAPDRGPTPLTAEGLQQASSADAQPRGTVHKNILDGAKRWGDVAGSGGTATVDEVLELMTTATTTTTATTAAAAAPPGKKAPTVVASPLSSAALALPPRPNAHFNTLSPTSQQLRTATPHRRLSRRGSQSETAGTPTMEQSRSTDDLMAEMLRLQEENEVAMHKRAVPRTS